MLVVIDTNVLVSAFWSKDGAPARILALILNGQLTPCHDFRILAEYRGVLSRSKFEFNDWEVSSVLSKIENDGMSVVPCPLNTPFTDKSDRKFYEVAKHCNAALITGNLKHFPQDGLVWSPSGFLSSMPEF